MRMVVGFSCLSACRNMGVNLKFHVSNTFLCLHAFGNVGTHTMHSLTCVSVVVCVARNAMPLSKLQ